MNATILGTTNATADFLVHTKRKGQDVKVTYATADKGLLGRLKQRRNQQVPVTCREVMTGQKRRGGKRHAKKQAPAKKLTITAVHA